MGNELKIWFKICSKCIYIRVLTMHTNSFKLKKKTKHIYLDTSLNVFLKRFKSIHNIPFAQHIHNIKESRRIHIHFVNHFYRYVMCWVWLYMKHISSTINLNFFKNRSNVLKKKQKKNRTSPTWIPDIFIFRDKLQRHSYCNCGKICIQMFFCDFYRHVWTRFLYWF